MFNIRQDIGSIGQVLIYTPTGLKGAAHGRGKFGFGQHISRENVQRKIVVQTKVAGRVGPINADRSSTGVFRQRKGRLRFRMAAFLSAVLKPCAKYSADL